VARRHPGNGSQQRIRELGGVFGVAVLASIFASAGGYRTHATFANGLTTAVYVGAGFVAVGALAAFLIPRARKSQAEVAALELAFEEAA
jgi:hypothetical protein